MRMEATIPDSRGATAIEMAEQLGLSRSQLIDEALSLFLLVAREIRRGRRVMTINPEGKEAACEIATPTLSALEWAARPARLDVSAKEVERIHALMEAAKAPGKKLREAAKKHRG